METPTLENCEPTIILLSEDIEPSIYKNSLLLCVEKFQIYMGNNIEKRLFYENHYIDKLTNGEKIEHQYRGSNNKIISEIFDAQIFNNCIVVGSECKTTIWIYDGFTMRIIKTINDCFTNYYFNKSQLYVRNETTGINVYDINFNFRYKLTTEVKCYAIQHSNDNYLICNYPSRSFYFAHASGIYLNDGNEIRSFNYKNTHETARLDDDGDEYFLRGFLQLDNGNYDCYVFINRTNLYVIDPTFRTILCHETWSISEKYVYKVVHIGGNYFDVYWNTDYSTQEPLTHIEHCYLKIPNNMTVQFELKTELVKRIRTDYWNPIYFLMRNIPNTQIVKRICSAGKIIEYFRDGSHIKYAYLAKDQKIIKITEQYTVCVLENKIFFGFNSNVVHVYDNKTLEFIKTFDDVMYFNTNANYLCLYKLDKTIECYDKDLKLCSCLNLNSCERDQTNNQLKTNTPSIVGMYQFQNIFTCYIVYLEIKGIQMYNVSTKNKRTITTYTYGNQEITIEYPQNICQITDDENNNYWLVSDTQTIYVINPTFECVIYYENLNIVIGQIKNTNGNYFDVFCSLKDNENREFSCVSQYMVKKITDANCIDEFNEF